MPREEKILFLGSDASLPAWLEEQGETVVRTSERVSVDFIDAQGCTWLVSYGYRYILKKPVLDRFADRAVNLHISLLPWNRGADPNFWSFIDDTPKGVTIHHLDEGVDTGDIIAQQELQFETGRETLATSYEKLQQAMRGLFKRHWPAIRNGSRPRQPQTGPGTTHRLADKEALVHLLTAGWDTPVSLLEEYAAETQASARFWSRSGID